MIETSKILRFLFYLLLFSIFLQIKVYILIMIISIILNISMIKNIKTNKETFWWGIFLMFSILNFLIFNENRNINIDYLLKLIINITFLITFELNISQLQVEKMEKKLINVIKIILFLNFCQILYIYIKYNIPISFFLNLSNSSEAYIIGKGLESFIVGNANKNIWASKVLFLGVVLIYYLKKSKTYRYWNFILLFNSILLLSRTIYLALFSFYCFNYIKIVRKKLQQSYIKYTLYILIFGVILIPIRIFFIKFLRIDLLNFQLEEFMVRKLDGGSVRFQVWLVFFKEFFKINFLTGIGLGNTQKFLILNNAYPNVNMHNFIIGSFLEQGILGGGIYMTAHYYFVKKIKKYAIILLIPFYIVISLQYFGYDNDIVVYIALVHIITRILKNKKGEIK